MKGCSLLCWGVQGTVTAADSHTYHTHTDMTTPEGLGRVCHAAKQGHQLQGIPQRTLLVGRDGQIVGEGLPASQLAQAL